MSGFQGVINWKKHTRMAKLCGFYYKYRAFEFT